MSISLRPSRVTCSTRGSAKRRRVPFVSNALALASRTAASMVAASIRPVFAQPDPTAAQKQWHRVIDSFRPRFPRLAQLMDGAEEEVLAYLAFPSQHRRRIWSNNPLERESREVKRRTNVVGIFPNTASVMRLVGIVLEEKHNE